MPIFFSEDCNKRAPFRPHPIVAMNMFVCFAFLTILNFSVVHQNFRPLKDWLALSSWRPSLVGWRPLYTTRNKRLLGAKGIATRSKDVSSSSWPYYYEEEAIGLLGWLANG